VPLTKVQLQAIHHRLARHHSRDSAFLRAIAAAMEPWRCSCGRLNKKTARVCGSCQWGYAPPPSQWQWQQPTWNAQWDENQWVKSPRRREVQSQSQSPRARTASPRQRTQQQSHKTRSRRKNGKNKQKQKDQEEELEEPPWEWQTPSLPALPASASSQSQATSKIEQKYKELVHQLKKTPEQLTPEVQALVTKEIVSETQGAAKSLHSMVSKMEKAQKALDAANGARLQLHSRWRTFMAAAIPRWTKWVEDFQKDDAELHDKIKTAKEYYDTIKEEYGQQQSSFHLKSPIEVEDDEESSVDQAAEKIKESMASMMQSLSDVKNKADQLHAEQEKTAKRPRLEHTGNEDKMDEGPSFGEPDRTGP